MTTIITAALIQDEFNPSGISATTLETIIDSAIDAVNQDAGTSIGYMTGTSGTKTLTVTGNQANAIKMRVAMALVDRKTQGSSSSSRSVLGLSMSDTTSTSQGSSYERKYDVAINRLKSPPIHIVNEPVEGTTSW